MNVKTKIFKNLAIILLSGIVLISCEKKENDPEDQLVGTWKSGTITSSAMVGDVTMSQYFLNQGLSSSDAQIYTNLFNVTVQQAFNGTMTLNADKTYTSNLGGQTDSGTWNISADNNQLTIDPSTGPPFILNIESLTDNELEVKWTETGSEDINQDNVPETISVEITMIFTKQ